ncbi:hypothetical protein CC78DRAFT_620919 [Lojkania enalia]|uniref:Uncharacterized protein n=1 Tax=Lojkania enalia TaxID=147567 RepID=A0A9P4K4W5_9PLEO|nr:hypothetical protein CC78DRAFT_620919 [Didymosphaeria enalia]
MTSPVGIQRWQSNIDPSPSPMSTFKGIIAVRPVGLFLSHVRSDRLIGLESMRAPFVYCSAATREILLRLKKYHYRVSYARGVVESRHVTYHRKLVPRNKIRVTQFDANHCIGAFMSLIEGDSKAILYTSDIRAETCWATDMNVVHIIPIATRVNGTEIAEIGAGDGKDNLDQNERLESEMQDGDGRPGLGTKAQNESLNCKYDLSLQTLISRLSSYAAKPDHTQSTPDIFDFRIHVIPHTLNYVALSMSSDQRMSYPKKLMKVYGLRPLGYNVYSGTFARIIPCVMIRRKRMRGESGEESQENYSSAVTKRTRLDEGKIHKYFSDGKVDENDSMYTAYSPDAGINNHSPSTMHTDESCSSPDAS